MRTGKRGGSKGLNERKKRISDVEAGYSIKECASRWVLTMGQFITG